MIAGAGVGATGHAGSATPRLMRAALAILILGSVVWLLGLSSPASSNASISFDLSAPGIKRWWYQDLYVTHRDPRGKTVVDVKGRLWWMFWGKAIWSNLNFITSKYQWSVGGEGAVYWQGYKGQAVAPYPTRLKKVQIEEKARTQAASVSVSFPLGLGFSRQSKSATLKLSDTNTAGLTWSNWGNNAVTLVGYSPEDVWKQLTGVAYFAKAGGSTYTQSFGTEEAHRCVRFGLSGHYRCSGAAGTASMARPAVASGVPGVRPRAGRKAGSDFRRRGRCRGLKPTIVGPSNGGKPILGTAHRDVILGGKDNEKIDGRGGDDVICGGPGNDRIDGGAGSDAIAGEGGADKLNGGSQADTLNGGAGRDRVDGGGGADKTFGGSDADRVDAGSGSDLASGGSGADSVSGGSEDDVVSGGSGADTSVGGDGSDQVAGGTGADAIDGGAGVDSLGGGSGNDVITDTQSASTVNAGSGSDTVTTGSENDKVVPDSGTAATNDPADGAPSGGTPGDGSALTAPLPNAVEFPGKGPSDPTVDYCFDCEATSDSTTESRDVVNTGAGNDTVTGSPGNDEINAGAGNDEVTGGSGDDTLNGEAGRDHIEGNTGADHIEGGDQRDVLGGGAGGDTIGGGGGGDAITGGSEESSDGSDVISGGDSVDELSGGAGNDSIKGDAGDDTAYGGSGSDVLDGGAGFDTSYGESDGAQGCTDSELAFQCGSSTGASDTSLPTQIGAGTDSSGCSAYADPDGDDGDPGTASRPLRTVEHLVNSLRAGEVGCLSGGGNFVEPDFEINVRSFGEPGKDIVLRTTPGASVPATISGRFYVRDGVHDLIVRNVLLDGRNPLARLRGVGAALPSPTVDGDNVLFTQVDASNLNSATCFVVGSVLGFGLASNVSITHSRIHDCGEKPNPLPNSGDHGIDLEASRNAVVADNLIYDNADRGILIYPDAQKTAVEYNVIDSNGRAISFGGEIVPATGWDPFYAPGSKVYPDETSVTGNVISNSTLNYSGEFERWQVEGFHPWVGPPTPSANTVSGNCLFHPNPSKNLQSPPIDFTPSANTVASSGPGFVNAGQKDFTLTGAPGTCPTSFGPRP